MSPHARNYGWIAAVMLVGWSVASPAPVEANVVVTYTTTQKGGNYAPRNIVATWVEDANGTFIKTIDRWANTQKRHLATWTGKAGANDADAISGATRQNHAAGLTATWDLKNKAGNEVPDGTYTIRMELADSNTAAQNDQGTYTFVKGATSATQSNLKSGGFTATIAYTPNASLTCNNGKVDVGETCDPPGSCPTTCAASADACMPNVLVGSAAGCTAACVAQPVSACVGGDGCCAAGCDATTDSDCAAASGDGQITGGCSAQAGGQLATFLVALGLFASRRRRR